jgi:DNA helicase II / ATP-dependent DNA helicase PcrA
MSVLRGLNQPQKTAVQYLAGPLLVLAGAGSGKTRTLTHRLAWLLERGVGSRNILAVTFTNKAADEMKIRLNKLLNSSCDLPYLGTFHSVAVRILRQELNGLDLPWNSSFIIYDEVDSEALVKEIMKVKKLGEDQLSPRQIRYLISQAKQERISPDRLSVDNFQEETVRSVYKDYQQRLKNNNSLDFDDLLGVLLQLLEEHPEVRKRYQQQFKHILVDEYQDTNLSQYQMVKLLAANHQNLAVVGDDWQSIYAFRGADFRNILNFQKDYPQAKVVRLEQNYRSTKNILAVGQRVIENNQQRSEKKLWTNRHKGQKPVLFEAVSGEEEASTVVRQIEKLARYPETVILYRTHAQSRLLEERLLYSRIPYRIIGGVRFYQRKEVKDIIAYLWLAQQDSPVHLARVINTPRRGIGLKTQELLQKKDWDLTKFSQPRLINFKRLLQELRGKQAEKPITELMEWLLKKLKYRQYLIDYSDTKEQAESRWENVQELLAIAERYQRLDPTTAREVFLEEAALMDGQDELDREKEKVTLMTLHNAKGLEFDNVFIVGLEEGLFPYQQSLESKTELEEERRLCYVGITRARDRLFLSWAQNRTIFGKLKTRQQSRFLDEISDELLDKVTRQEDYNQDQPVDQPSLTKGDLIQHLQLGRGRVVSFDDELVEIEFPKIGRKKFSLEYAPLKKISGKFPRGTID